MARRPKARPRGESDLGRPNTLYNARPRSMTVNGSMMLKRTGSSIGTPKTSASSQIISGFIMPLPWIIGSLSYRYNLEGSSSPLSTTDGGQQGRIVDAFIHACAICAIGFLAAAVTKMMGLESDSRDKQVAAKRASQAMATPFSIQAQHAARTISGLLIPMFCVLQFGEGISTALLFIVVHSCGLAYGSDIDALSIWLNYRGRLASCAFVLLWSFLFGSSSLNIFVSGLLLLALFWAPNPLLEVHSPVSNGVELSHTFLAGASMGALTFFGMLFSPSSISFTWAGTTTFLIAGAFTSAAILYIEPRHFYNKSHLAISTAIATTFLLSSFSIHSALSFLLNAGLSTACFAGAWYDSGEMLNFAHEHKPKSSGQGHSRTDCSQFTRILLESTTPGSILHSILSERDSRRIAYFGFLNLAFMVVQFSYGFLTGSLGLLTDSIHMLFDCIGLAVGLAAAVMSKWPPTVEFPYGYSKIDTLSGFANGIFLILVSVEIVFDALHRLREGYELRRLNELLVVSILGFLVNIVGLTAFGHAHHHGHGHSHDHSHGHSHSHGSHTHAHSNSNELSHHHHNHNHKNSNGSLGHTHNHSNSQDSKTQLLKPSLFPAFSTSTPAVPTSHNNSHSHGHEHTNENMEGIFLHILADALGSVAVIISTILTKFNSWHGWDPLASCLIAILIFFSAIPLVKRSGSRLLLSLSDEAEYSCRGALQGISELRGVQGYAGVRLWMADQDQPLVDSHSHGHEHHHSHDNKGHHNGHHNHEHQHTHDQVHVHESIQEHPHEHNGTADNPKSPISILGVIHIVATPIADIDDVRERAEQYFRSRGMDIVVHVEKEGDARCWCGVGMRNSLGSPLKSSFS